MKKGIAGFLAVLMLLSLMFSFAGCGGKQTKKSAAAASDKQAVSGENGSGEKATEPVEEQKPQPSEPEITAPSVEVTEPPEEAELVSVWAISKTVSHDGYSGNIIETVVVYDENGNLTEKTQSKGDTIITQDTYTYNEAGQLVQQIQYSSNLDGLEEISRRDYTFDSTGKLIEKKEYELGMELSHEVYSYDTAGNLTGQTDYRNGEQTFQHTYRYDSMGNRIQAIRLNKNQQSMEKKAQYDESGKLLEYYVFYNGAESYHSTYSYNENGLLTEKIAGYSQMGETYRTVFAYDAQGRLTEKSEMINDVPYSRNTYTYDESGNIIEMVLYVDGAEYDRAEYIYDSEGRPLEGSMYEEGFRTTYTTYEVVKMEVTQEQKQRMIAQGVVFDVSTNDSYVYDTI